MSYFFRTSSVYEAVYERAKPAPALDLDKITPNLLNLDLFPVAVFGPGPGTGPGLNLPLYVTLALC